MSNSDILGKADRVLRPVLKELGRLPWARLEGCCAGHKPEDNLWIELTVLGASGLARMMELLRILDTKLAGTEIRVDCLLNYASPEDAPPVPHGWIPAAVEIFWPGGSDWKRSQSMIIESLLSTIEEFASRAAEPYDSNCAINYCPFCSSSFIRIESLETSGGHRYRCGDCDKIWLMINPVV
jgi:hypothetical protein